MPYATKAYMINRYGTDALIELTDRVEPFTGAIVDAVLDQALADSDAIINSYIGGRYKLPLDVTPDALIGHAGAMTYYNLHRDRYPDEVRKAYEDALKFLGDIASGKAVLDAAGVEPKSAAADARVEAPERIFNREELKVY